MRAGVGSRQGRNAFILHAALHSSCGSYDAHALSQTLGRRDAGRKTAERVSSARLVDQALRTGSCWGKGEGHRKEPEYPKWLERAAWRKGFSDELTLELTQDFHSG